MKNLRNYMALVLAVIMCFGLMATTATSSMKKPIMQSCLLKIRGTLRKIQTGRLTSTNYPSQSCAVSATAE